MTWWCETALTPRASTSYSSGRPTRMPNGRMLRSPDRCAFCSMFGAWWSRLIRFRSQGLRSQWLCSDLIGPPDEDAEWSDAAIAGPVRFLQHVWRLVESPDSFPITGSEVSVALLHRGVHQAI